MPAARLKALEPVHRLESPRRVRSHFRGSFRDWCAEATGHAGEVAELALAHTVRDKAEAAHMRGDLMEKRRRLMEDWAGHCESPLLPPRLVPFRSAN